MATSACADQYEAVDPLFSGFLRMFNINDIVVDNAPIAVGGFHNICRGAQTGDDNGHLIFHAGFHIFE